MSFRSCFVLLFLILSLGFSFPTVAQTISGLSWSENDIGIESYIPVFTSGNLEIAPVFLDGKVVGTVESFIQLRSDKDSNTGSFYSAATRSHLIHSKLQKILDNMNRYSQEILPQRGILGLNEQERELKEQLVTSVSEENGNKVVLVTFPQDDVPEIVYTVTPATVEKPRFGGSQPLKIAQKNS